MTCSKQCPCASCQNVLKNVLWCIMARLCIKCSDQFCLFSKNRDGRSVQNSLRRWVLSQTRDLWCNYVNRDFVCVSSFECFSKLKFCQTSRSNSKLRFSKIKYVTIQKHFKRSKSTFCGFKNQFKMVRPKTNFEKLNQFLKYHWAKVSSLPYA